MADRRRQYGRRGMVAGAAAVAEPDTAEKRFTAEVLLFAWVAEMAGTRNVRVRVPRGVRAATLVARTLQKAGLDSTLGTYDCVRLAVNRTYVDPDHVIEPGDELAIIPPISGGAE